jgi:hypothetical protein
VTSKKRKRRPSTRTSRDHTRAAGGAGGAPTLAQQDGPSKEEARRLRREEGRRQAQARLRAMRRRRLLRRGLVAGALLAVLGAGVFYLVSKQQAKSAVMDQARQVAAAAGCTEVITKPDRGASHQPPYTYDQRPATSGPHAGPLPPDQHVYPQPVPEESAVHNLEHGYVLLYYSRDGQQALPTPVVGSLERLADSESKVIMAPYAQMESGNALALVAWNNLQQCPSSVSPQQAETLARAFITRFRGGGEAPEPGAP